MKGWFYEPARHAMAARGIRTRAIPNPIASPDLYDEEWYGRKGHREFVGSGLEGLYSFDIINQVMDYIRIFDGTQNYENDWNMEDYHHSLSSMHRGMRNIPHEEFEKMFDYDRRFLEIESIYVTGSRVSGFYLPDSDIDVYIQIKNRSEFEKYGIDTEYLFDKMQEAVNEVMYHNDMEMKVYDQESKDYIKVDVTIISTDPPTKPAIEIWEGSVW